MAQENKELLFKDLSARLPYGVICEYTSIQPGYELYNEIGVLESIQKDYQSYKFVIDGHLCGFSDFKPYLRPMSSMTEEERNELSHYDNSVQRTDFFYSHHIDCRFMIEKGLALEAPEGMYNIKEQ
jgi:hypothetical protein